MKPVPFPVQAISKRKMLYFFYFPKIFNFFFFFQLTEATKQHINDAFQKYDNGVYSKEQFKSFLYNDLSVKKTPTLDARLNRVDLKYSDIVRFLERKEKYQPTSSLKPNHLDPTKINIMAKTPSLMSFQNERLMKNSMDSEDKYPEKKELMETVHLLLNGQVNPSELESKLDELQIKDEVSLNFILFYFCLMGKNPILKG